LSKGKEEDFCNLVIGEFAILFGASDDCERLQNCPITKLPNSRDHCARAC
jgi:hypothetical protein